MMHQPMKTKNKTAARIPLLACLSLAFLLPVSCATAPRTAASQAVRIPPYLSSAAPARGALIDAVPLAMESASGYLDTLKPEILGLKLNVQPVAKAGFFGRLDSLKPAMKPVRQIRIHYWSEDARGRPIQLSGIVYLPAGGGEDRQSVPLLLFCHGTQVLRDRVPSRLSGSERPLAVVAAAAGMAVAMPDYPGLGDGEGFHPYCHAASLGHACVDMLRAARALLRLPGVAPLYAESPCTLVAGYSEGGYAAMAAFRELTLTAHGEFPLKAVFPMAGPFDMSVTMKDLMLDEAPIVAPYYLPFTILGWSASHPAMRPAEALKDEYLDALLPLFDGRNSASRINGQITALQGVAADKGVAAAMLRGGFRRMLTAPEGSEEARALSAALKENDIWDWPYDPEVPVYFMAVPKDEVVPFANSRKALDACRARGGRGELRELQQAGHESGGYEACGFMLLKAWDILGM